MSIYNDIYISGGISYETHYDELFIPKVTNSFKGRFWYFLRLEEFDFEDISLRQR